MVDRLLKNRKFVNTILGLLLTALGYMAGDVVRTLKLDVAQAQAEISRLNSVKVDRAEFQQELRSQFDEYKTLLDIHERNSARRFKAVTGVEE